MNCLSCVGSVNIISLSSPERIVYHVLALLIFYHCLLLSELFISVGLVNILSLSSPEGNVFHVLALLIFYHCLLLGELFFMCWPC